MNTTQTGFARQLRRLVAGQVAGALSDQQLLEQFVTRQEQASFAALVRRHGPMVMGVCCRVLRHTQDAEDAFQATFLVLARRASSIRKQESVGSFLHGVAYRVAAKMRAQAVRRAAREREMPVREYAPPAEDLTWRELRSVLDEELQGLPEQYRGPLVLCYLEGATQDEAARRLGWSMGTFRRRLEQGRARLVQRLTRRGMSLSAALVAPLLIEGNVGAAVPVLLAESTVRNGIAFALARTSAGVPAQVAALVEGGFPAVLSAKLKTAAVLLIVAGLAVGGMLTRQTLNARSADTPAITATPPDAPKPKPASPVAAEKEKTIEIKGQVYDPDGKPFAGAEVYLVPKTARKKADLTVHVSTDKAGRFQLRANLADVGKGTRLLVMASGYGPDWADLNKDQETTLRLVKDDWPLRGRVLDLEGRPIAGATVQVLDVAKRASGGDLTPWLRDHTKRGRDWRREEVSMAYLRPALLGIPLTETTRTDGRFRLSGFGRERLVILRVSGPTIESYSQVRVLTHAGPATGWATDYDHIYPFSFDFVASPGKPVLGTVRDRATGKPLAGIHVKCYKGGVIGGFDGSGYAVTDEQGRYRLSGVGKAKEYTIAAEGGPYFNVTKWHIGDTPGAEPVTVDFELTRGIPLRVRLTDKITGKPVRGSVHYLAHVENPHLKDYPGFGQELSFSPVPAGERPPEGTSTTLAIPGRAFICVRAEDLDRYIGFELKDWDGFLLPAVPGNLHPSQFHAVIPMDVSEKDPKTTNIDIALEPGRTRTGTVVGSDGKPLSGVYVAGLTPVWHFDPSRQPRRLKDEYFTVLGLNPRKERIVVFFHPEKKLGKVQRIRGDEKEPLTVRLEPLGTITGRVLDAKGHPWGGLVTETRLNRLITVYKDLPWELLDGFDRLLEIKLRTNAEGRFRVEGLLPGLPYDLVFAEEEIKAGTRIVYHEKVTGERVKTKDLGDLKSKVTPEKK